MSQQVVIFQRPAFDDGTNQSTVFQTKESVSGPSLLYGLAFAAIHCYVTTHDYRAAIRHCDIALNLINTGKAGHIYPFIFANDLAILLDKSMQAVIGILLVFARFRGSRDRPPRVCLRMSIRLFFQYIRIQCMIKTGGRWLKISDATRSLKNCQLGYHRLWRKEVNWLFGNCYLPTNVRNSFIKQ